MALAAFAGAGAAAPALAQSRMMDQGHVGDCVGCHGKQDANRFRFEAAQTRVAFSLDAFGFSRVTGEFRGVDGGFRFDQGDPEKSGVVASLRPADVRIGDALMTAVVRERFFAADKHPVINFTSHKVTRTGADAGRVDGSLQLMGVTRPVTLDVRFNQAGRHPVTEDMVAGFTARARLKRSDFGMALGLPAIGDDVEITIEVLGKRLE
jgi:polyisoprenoid-binding protein YceI